MPDDALDRRQWLKLLLAGAACLGGVGGGYPRPVVACTPERQTKAAMVSQALFDGEVLPCSKDWLVYCSCHCTADRLHAGIDFETPDAQPVHAVTAGFALNIKIGLGAVTVLTDDFRYACGRNHGVTIVYFHLQNIQIKVGQRVELGTHLGDVMNVGGPDGIPFLHLEVRKGWQAEPTSCHSCSEQTRCSSCEGSFNTADITLDPLVYLV
jgi:murein DD-endopeptidase MepM/ murein hydrolase activator NlpD